VTICCLNCSLRCAAVPQVNPHRIKEMDVQFMARLSQAAPVIPILAKARRCLPCSAPARRRHAEFWSTQLTQLECTPVCPEGPLQNACSNPANTETLRVSCRPTA
jgi:hypothetical protein